MAGKARQHLPPLHHALAISLIVGLRLLAELLGGRDRLKPGVVWIGAEFLKHPRRVGNLVVRMNPDDPAISITLRLALDRKLAAMPL